MLDRIRDARHLNKNHNKHLITNCALCIVKAEGLGEANCEL